MATLSDKKERLHTQIRQLILMRETGPKSAAWHRARTHMIWRLHEEWRAALQEGAPAPPDQPHTNEADAAS